jgi:hypothetical protein
MKTSDFKTRRVGETLAISSACILLDGEAWAPGRARSWLQRIVF